MRSIFKQILVNRCQWDEVDLGWGACPLSPVVGVVKEFCEALGHVMTHVNHLWALQTHVVSCGNLRPLLNGESLKNWPNGEFEKRMSQIWSIFKQMFENRSIFKQMFENTVHFQTYFEKYLPRPGGAAGGGARGIFPTSVWKWTIFGSSYFQNRHLATFSNFHNFTAFNIECHSPIKCLLNVC